MKTQGIWLSIGVVLLSLQGSAQWVHTTFSDRAAYCFAVSGNTLFVGHNSLLAEGVSLSSDFGVTWTGRSAGLPRNLGVQALMIVGTKIFAGPNMPNGGVYVSDISGDSWTASNNGFPSNTRIFALASSGTNLFAGGYIGVYRSTNNGSDWSAANSGLPVSIAVFGFAVSDSFVFAANLSHSTGGVFVSANQGSSWTRCNLGMTDTSVNVLINNHHALFAGTDSGVFLSTNNGGNWHLATEGLGSPMITAFAASDSVLFAGTYGAGVFMSTNNGITWDSINVGLTDRTVWALALSGVYLFAGTGTGVWRRPLSELLMAIEPDANTIPHDFLLAQNYPNPFNPTTTIGYALPHRSHVTLTIYNTLGQLVERLIDGDIEAGYHEVTFEATGVASGVYFYRIQARSGPASGGGRESRSKGPDQTDGGQAGDFTQTRKLCLIR